MERKAETKVPEIERHKSGYVKIRVTESLQEITLALKMLREGFTRNAAQRAFIAWKAMVSALTVMNLDRLPRDEEERKWYHRVGYKAPKAGLRWLADRLEDIGYQDYKLTHITSTALALHRYAYHGLAEGESDYISKEDVMSSIMRLARDMLPMVVKLFKNYWDEGLEVYYEIAKKELEAVRH